MAKSRSEHLVIDASVAQAAGPEKAVHPTAKRCRDFLLAILSICHRATFSPEIEEEWDKHQSSFAFQWRVSMFARKKIDRIGSRQNLELRRKTREAAAGEKQAEAMLKDIHLVEAALESGKRIASLDEIVRRYFRSSSQSVGQLRTICWINPNGAEEEPLEWLRSGAPLDAFRKLGHTTDRE